MSLERLRPAARGLVLVAFCLCLAWFAPAKLPLAGLDIASRAHAVVLSWWQVVHGFGILYASVIDGVMNLNVWLRTLTSPNSCAIAGM